MPTVPPRGKLGLFKPTLDEERHDKFVQALREGANYRIAAGLAGIPHRTAQRWLSRGTLELNEWADACEDDEDQEPPGLSVYARFAYDSAIAVAQRDHELIQKIEQGGIFDDKGKSTWTHLAWLLERMRPDEFALRSDVKRVEITGAGGGPIQQEVRVAAVAQILQAAGATGAKAALDQPEDRDARPRRALPPAAKLLAEPSVGERPASSVPSPRR